MLLIDWDEIESHSKFIADPSYKPFKAGLISITENIHLFHITPVPFPPSILSQAPCIEFATFFSAEPGFVTNVREFVAILDKNKEDIDGYFGANSGESVEEIVKWSELGTEEAAGKQAKAVTAFIGWESKEHHTRFRETELFKKNIGLLRVKNRGAELFHVAFNAV